MLYLITINYCCKELFNMQINGPREIKNTFTCSFKTYYFCSSFDFIYNTHLKKCKLFFFLFFCQNCLNNMLCKMLAPISVTETVCESSSSLEAQDMIPGFLILWLQLLLSCRGRKATEVSFKRGRRPFPFWTRKLFFCCCEGGTGESWNRRAETVCFQFKS